MFGKNLWTGVTFAAALAAESGAVPDQGLVAFFPFSGSFENAAGTEIDPSENHGATFATDRFGNENVSHNLERGAMVGSNSAIMPQIPNDTAIQALTTVLVLWIPYQALLTAGTKLGRTHGLVMKNMLEAFCKKNVLMVQKIKILSQKTLRERLILYLLYK